jgi:hypothetical protein
MIALVYSHRRANLVFNPSALRSMTATHCTHINRRRLMALYLLKPSTLLASQTLPAAAGTPATPSGLPSTAAAMAIHDFDWVIDTVRRNYAGWQNKAEGSRQVELAALTGQLRLRVSTGDEKTLREALRTWIGWFRDGHLQLEWNAQAGTELWPNEQRIAREADIRRVLRDPKRDPILGFWRIDDMYTLGVLPQSGIANQFDAVVLRTAADGWQPGDLKAVLVRIGPGAYRIYYSTLTRTKLTLEARLDLRNERLDTQGVAGVWRRLYDTPRQRRAALRRYPGSEPAFERIDDRTVYLRAPSFRLESAKELLALVERHQAEISRSPQLVLDIRHNGGGGNSSYEPLLPFLYTRPFVLIGREYRVSADNKRLYREIARQLRALRPDLALEVEAIVAAMETAQGPFVLAPGRGFRITTLPHPTQQPARVALLIDGAASAAEDLILTARQSRSVVLMGQQRSAGVVDFAEMVSMTSPSARFTLAWATTRTLRLPEDPVDEIGGIAPDVWIPAGVDDPVAWAARALNRLR